MVDETNRNESVESAVDRVCFVIGPVDEEGNDTRRHADQLLRHIIEPAAKASGLSTVLRADHIDSSGVITTEIVGLLESADLVVADLSMANPNVYYELAVRHLLRKPFVHMLRDGEHIPFDVNPTRVVRFNLGDLDSSADAKDALTRTIETELDKKPSAIETPFTIALDRRQLTVASAAEPNDAMAELSREVLRIGRDIRRLRIETRDLRVDQSVAVTTAQSLADGRERSRDRLRATRSEIAHAEGELVVLRERGNGLRHRLANDPEVVEDIPLRERLDHDLRELLERIAILNRDVDQGMHRVRALEDAS